jgi:hypothetical protein
MEHRYNASNEILKWSFFYALEYFYNFKERTIEKYANSLHQVEVDNDFKDFSELLTLENIIIQDKNHFHFSVFKGFVSVCIEGKLLPVNEEGFFNDKGIATLQNKITRKVNKMQKKSKG